MAWLLAPALVIALVARAPAGNEMPALAPLDDLEATRPLLPESVSRSIPEFFGDYVYIWAEDNVQVLQYHGHFRVRLGERRLQGREAVVWMQKSIWKGTVFYHFEVFLSGDVEVRDSSGTVTTAPLLFVTFNSAASPVVEADVHTGESSADSKLYAEAAKIRQAMLAEATLGQPEDLRATVPGFQEAVARPKARPLVSLNAREREYNQQEGTLTAIGSVYLSQGLVDSDEFLEIRADAVVLFMARRSGESAGEAGPIENPFEEPFPVEVPQTPRSDTGRGLMGIPAGLQAAVSGAYLRGNVVLSRGDRMIRAAELYYDFENDRALILDAVMRAMAPERDIPIYVRARQVRQLSTTEYFARKAMISASEFHTPHVYIGAERVFLTDSTPRDESGRITGFQAGKYRAYDATLNLEGVPVFYWPYSAGDFRQTQSPVKSVRFAYSDDFGASFQSKWYLFNLLGLEKPEGIDGQLRLDYFSERGPGAGVDLDWETENSLGLFRSYYINDHGEDDLGDFRDGTVPHEDRGRLTFRHKQFLPDGWELTLEASYISDRNFMEEYFNAEFEEGKEQETLIYLKKQQDNWAFTALNQWRILDFLTQTEHFPDLGLHWVGEPLGEIASYYNETDVALVRLRADQGQIFNSIRSSETTFRADTRNEIQIPIKLPGANLVPFAMVRPGYWTSSPGSPDYWDDQRGGDVNRLFGQLGARFGSQLWRVYNDVQSKLFDVNGIRHIIQPQLTAWASSSNQDSRELYAFDPGIENIDDFYGTSIALRQTWQTKRGGPGQWRNVDWITFDVELNLFGDEPQYSLPIGRYYDHRPEDSIARNHVRTDFIYRLSDTTAILAESNFDLNDGSLDLFDISYAVERTPRFSYFLGYRRINDTDSELVGGGFHYVLNEKYRVGFRSYYDLDRNELEELELAIIRKFPRFYGAVTLDLQKVPEDISIGVSLWPEGAPRAVLGNRRYAALSESTGIRPQD